MEKKSGKSVLEVFAAEQEIACKELEKIKLIVTRSDRDKELVLSDVDAETIHEICDWVQEHLQGRRQRLATLVRNDA